MKETERKTKITLEDLLQIKRAERPPAEFWPQFEQALRAKQLAAIVETRPWWRSLTTKKTFVRLCVPLGAAAVVAMTFGSFRGVSVKPTLGNSSSGVVTVQTPSALGESVAMQQESMARSSVTDVVTTTPEVQSSAADSPSAVAVAQPASNDSTSSSEQMLASSSATVKAAGQALAQLVGLVGKDTDPSGNARAAVVEPLTQVVTPRDSRRARLLAYSVAFDPHAADSSASVRSRERITRRISDESIYDSISRLGLSGDRVSIKF